MKIKINGKYYDFFNDVTIQTSLAAVASTFSFTAKYDPVNPVHKELFRPLTYFPVIFYDDDDDRLLATCTLIQHRFNSEAAPNLTLFSGYSHGGVIEDCQIPPKAYPLESNNRTLNEIATRLLNLFNIKLIIYDSAIKECNQVIEKSVAKPEETIKDYLCKIAAQKNVIISHDIHGNIIMFRPDVTALPKLYLTQENTLTMGNDVNGQGLHSDLTSIRQPAKGDGNNPFTNDYEDLPDFDSNPSSFKISSIDTVKNPLVGTFRPSVDVLSSGTFYDTITAAKNRRAAELQNIKIPFSLNYWPKVSVGDVVEVMNPEIYINNRTRMIIESTSINESGDSKTMSGVLVLPETFNGNDPKNIFA